MINKQNKKFRAAVWRS